MAGFVLEKVRFRELENRFNILKIELSRNICLRHGLDQAYIGLKSLAFYKLTSILLALHFRFFCFSFFDFFFHFLFSIFSIFYSLFSPFSILYFSIFFTFFIFYSLLSLFSSFSTL